MKTKKQRFGENNIKNMRKLIGKLVVNNKSTQMINRYTKCRGKRTDMNNHRRLDSLGIKGLFNNLRSMQPKVSSSIRHN